jgi:hypothetical protein
VRHPNWTASHPPPLLGGQNKPFAGTIKPNNPRKMQGIVGKMEPKSVNMSGPMVSGGFPPSPGAWARATYGREVWNTSCGKRLKGRTGSSPVLKLIRITTEVEGGRPSRGSAVYLRR